MPRFGCYRGAGGRWRAYFLCLVIGFVGTLGSGGCGRCRPDLTTYHAPIPKDGVVFVADGAGNYQCASAALQHAANQGRIPVQVVTFEWSHGYLRSFADLMHLSHARAQGRKLAAQVQEYRLRYPDKPVYLVGHSAGSMVILSALEELPPESVDRAVLISASISAYYDIRPALQAVKKGLHNFHSRHDWLYCGVLTRLLGNSDRSHAICAGRVGFRPPPCAPEISAKLVDRAWTWSDAIHGNEGGHFGNYKAPFLRANILPLFQER